MFEWGWEAVGCGADDGRTRCAFERVIASSGSDDQVD
jgi:hypothetical protein